MNEFIARPLLLLLAPLIYWLVLRLVHSQQQTGGWEKILPPELAARLLLAAQQQSGSAQLLIAPRLMAGLLALLLTLALSGPGYTLPSDNLTQPRQELVILQQLSPPIRGTADAHRWLELSQRLLVPLLNSREQGQTALIFYAGSAHLASPMTEDAATLRQLLSLTHPSVMPRAGQQPEAAFRLAATTGQLAADPRLSGSLQWLWLTPVLPSTAEMQRLMRLMPDRVDALVLVWLDATPADAQAQQQQWQEFDRLQLLHSQQAAARLQQINQSAAGAAVVAAGVPLFRELGHWLLLPGLLLLAWHATGQPLPRGWTEKIRYSLLPGMVLLLCAGFLMPRPLLAGGPFNKDYRAWQALQQQQPARALQQARSNELKGHALFELQRYVEAAEAFVLAAAEVETGKRQADLLFNAGTSLLLAAEVERALVLLRQVELLQPQRIEPCINRVLAEALLAQQPLPDQQALQQACSGGSERQPEAGDSGEADSQTQPQPWQPRRQASCPGCTPLDDVQEQQLEQLQEDPWRLLRLRFQTELREQQP
ncbi:hypothetical protein [Marinospirillum alkaliphilum]|uniref:Ca-activated chloride channel family protein n=1 Tax=Marinospirillum alkaliphilum DSM 21637 TaxID=1122209 RepID=A0A1K1YG08_9GAMM|nr:hypothetical protein [Marinospirillum alkaliphilum]SFX60800.1 Ca-activated chloride channel family protein [Marinospirillum alkaliphilum DSM 21637]